MSKKKCAGGFLMKEDKFLFGKRSTDKSWAAGLWDIVGGHSKKHEKPYKTLKRETKEEIGVKVIDAELIKKINVFDESENKVFKYYIYMITEWSGEAENCSDEHTELRWFSRSELDTIPIALKEYRQLIDEWMDDHKS